MADNGGEKRALPNVPGYNTYPSEDPVIAVEWDEPNNRLVITADQPIFDGYDTEGWLDAQFDAGGSAVGAHDKYVDDSTLHWVSPALGWRPTDLLQITFSRGATYAERETEHVWEGSVFIPQEGTFEVSYDGGADEITVDAEGVDMTVVVTVDFEGNGGDPPSGPNANGTLTSDDFDTTAGTLVIPSDTVAGMGIAHLYELVFKNSGAGVVGTWTGDVSLF